MKTIFKINARDEQRLNALMQTAQAHRNTTYDIVISGFRFSVTCDDEWFECAMHFAPGWGHTVNGMSDTHLGVYRFIEDQINYASKHFPRGGEYPADYPTNF